MSSWTELGAPTDVRTTHQFAPLRLGAGPVLVDEHEAARSAGYAEGWAHGRRDAIAAQADLLAAGQEERRRLEQALAGETQAACDALATAVRQLSATTVPVLEDAADVVLDAAVRLAEAVLGAELQVLDDTATLALRRALAPLPDDGRVVVRMNPQDLQVVRAAGENAADAGQAQRVEGHEVELVADPTLRRGEAVADQGAARVDARLGAALRRAIAAAGLLVDDHGSAA
ncbi:MAG TPA: FliH/SctL family protein [Actinomycetales bacterium]|nr:FliH/SctL family protein [Actinomycetales bacterium]